MVVRLGAAHPAPLHVDLMAVARPVRGEKGIVARPLAVPKVSNCLALSKAKRLRAVAQLALPVGRVRQSDARPRAALRVSRVLRLSVPRALLLDGLPKRKLRVLREKQEDVPPVEQWSPDEPRQALLVPSLEREQMVSSWGAPSKAAEPLALRALAFLQPAPQLRAAIQEQPARQFQQVLHQAHQPAKPEVSAMLRGALPLRV
jgi:hypothetical protein